MDLFPESKRLHAACTFICTYSSLLGQLQVSKANQYLKRKNVYTHACKEKEAEPAGLGSVGVYPTRQSKLVSGSWLSDVPTRPIAVLDWDAGFAHPGRSPIRPHCHPASCAGLACSPDPQCGSRSRGLKLGAGQQSPLWLRGPAVLEVGMPRGRGRRAEESLLLGTGRIPSARVIVRRVHLSPAGVSESFTPAPFCV